MKPSKMHTILRHAAAAAALSSVAFAAQSADVAAGLTGPDTLLAAMKGQRREIDEELEALPADCTAGIEPIRVPFLDAERHLVLIRRGPTAARPA